MPTLEANPTTLNPFHIMPPLNFKKEEEEFYDPTPEDLEDIRRAEENRAKGEYYEQRDGETVREFVERIMADPVNQMVCNLTK